MPDKQCSSQSVLDEAVRMHSFTQGTLPRPDLQGSLSNSRGWWIFHKIEGVRDFGLVAGFSVWLTATCLQGSGRDVLDFGGKVNILYVFSCYLNFYSNFSTVSTKQIQEINTHNVHVTTSAALICSLLSISRCGHNTFNRNGNIFINIDLNIKKVRRTFAEVTG